MSLEDNKTIARRFLEESVMQGNLEVYDTSFAPHLVAHLYGIPPHSHASYRVFVQQAHPAFADHSLMVDELVAEGDTVAIRLSFAAKAHLSHLGKTPPTGQPVQFDAMFFFHFEQGKVVELWALYQGADFDFSPA